MVVEGSSGHSHLRLESPSIGSSFNPPEPGAAPPKSNCSETVRPNAVQRRSSPESCAVGVCYRLADKWLVKPGETSAGEGFANASLGRL